MRPTRGTFYLRQLLYFIIFGLVVYRTSAVSISKVLAPAHLFLFSSFAMSSSLLSGVVNATYHLLSGVIHDDITPPPASVMSHMKDAYRSIVKARLELARLRSDESSDDESEKKSSDDESESSDEELPKGKAVVSICLDDSSSDEDDSVPIMHQRFRHRGIPQRRPRSKSPLLARPAAKRPCHMPRCRTPIQSPIALMPNPPKLRRKIPVPSDGRPLTFGEVCDHIRSMEEAERQGPFPFQFRSALDLMPKFDAAACRPEEPIVGKSSSEGESDDDSDVSSLISLGSFEQPPDEMQYDSTSSFEEEDL